VKLAGVTLETWDSSAEALFVNGTASALGVAPSEIEVLGVREAEAQTRRRRLHQTEGGGDGLFVDFVVQSRMIEGGASALAETLEERIETGEYVDALNSAGLSQVTGAEPLEVTVVRVVNSEEEGAEEGGDGNISVVVIGAAGAGGALVLAVACVVLSRRRLWRQQRNRKRENKRLSGAGAAPPVPPPLPQTVTVLTPPAPDDADDEASVGADVHSSPRSPVKLDLSLLVGEDMTV